MKKIIYSLLLAFIGNTYAATATAPLVASAQLQPSCRLSMEDIAIGDANTPGFDKTALGMLSVVCNKDVTSVASFSAGSSGLFNQRYMTDGTPGSDHLNYRLYLNGSANTTYLGDGNNGSATITLLGTGSSVTKFINAQVPRDQYIKAGNYSDSLTLTLSY